MRLAGSLSTLLDCQMQPAHMIFTEGGATHNQIVIRLQLNGGVEPLVNNKVPGPGGLRLEPKLLNLNLADGCCWTRCAATRRSAACGAWERCRPRTCMQHSTGCCSVS